MHHIDYNLLQVINTIRDDLLLNYETEEEIVNEIYEYLVHTVEYANETIVEHIIAFYQFEYPEMVSIVENALNNDEEDNDEYHNEESENIVNDELPDNIFADIEEYIISRSPGGSLGLRRIQISNASPILERLNRYSYIRDNLNNSPITSQLEDIKVTLKKTKLDKIECKKYQEVISNDPSNNKCVICQEDFIQDDIVRKLDCNHVFHSTCIDEWLLGYSYKCPICRAECGEYEAKIPSASG